MKAVYPLGKDGVKNGIVAIGQSLIKKSDEVSNDKNYIAMLESEENKSE